MEQGWWVSIIRYGMFLFDHEIGADIHRRWKSLVRDDHRQIVLIADPRNRDVGAVAQSFEFGAGRLA